MNRLKIKLLSSLFTLAILLAVGYSNCSFADTGDVGVYINGAVVEFPDAKPYISDNRTLVPVRFISEHLGADVDWNGDTNTVTVTKDGESIELIIGSTEVVEKGAIHSMDVAPVITEGRTMVPLRFVSEQLGVDVDWDSSSNSVIINTEKSDGTEVYAIKTGDTLWKIASTYGVSLDELINANPGMNPDKLMVGQQIYLPSGAVEGQDSSSEEADTDDQDDTTDEETPVVSRGGGRAISLDCSADELVEYAKEFLGVPYQYGGATPDGFDCSGFTQYVVANFDGYLPHSSSEQYSYGISVEKDELQPGDLVFFSSSGDSSKIGHVGIYVGDGKFIHAPQAGGSVELSNMTNVYFAQYYYGAVRMETDEGK